MSEILVKIEEFFKEVLPRLPLLFALNSQKIFWAGMVVVLLMGSLVFYSKTYVSMNANYDAPVLIRKINQDLFNQIFQYITDRREPSGLLPMENPFEP